MSVSKYIINPLNQWFGRDLPLGRAEVYYEVLGKYSASILEKALSELKATWVSQQFPQAAAIKEICDRIYRESAVPKAPVGLRKNMDFWAAAEKIMPTKIGALAVKECWARSLVCEVMATGKLEFTEDDIKKFREGRDKAVASIRNLSADNPHDKMLLEFWWTTQSREQELIDKYKGT